MPVVKLVPEETIFFLCDVQTRFSTLLILQEYDWRLNWRPVEDVIHGYDHVVAISNKMFKIAKVSTICLNYFSVTDNIDSTPGARYTCRGDWAEP